MSRTARVASGVIGGVNAPPVRMPVVASGSTRPLQTAVLGTMWCRGGEEGCRGERAERASGAPRACAGERDAFPSSSERYPSLRGMPQARGPISSRSGYLAMRHECRWKRMIVSEAYPAPRPGRICGIGVLRSSSAVKARRSARFRRAVGSSGNIDLSGFASMSPAAGAKRITIFAA